MTWNDYMKNLRPLEAMYNWSGDDPPDKQHEGPARDSSEPMYGNLFNDDGSMNNMNGGGPGGSYRYWPNNHPWHQKQTHANKHVYRPVMRIIDDTPYAWWPDDVGGRPVVDGDPPVRFEGDRLDVTWQLVPPISHEDDDPYGIRVWDDDEGPDVPVYHGSR